MLNRTLLPLPILTLSVFAFSAILSLTGCAENDPEPRGGAGGYISINAGGSETEIDPRTGSAVDIDRTRGTAIQPAPHDVAGQAEPYPNRPGTGETSPVVAPAGENTTGDLGGIGKTGDLGAGRDVPGTTPR